MKFSPLLAITLLAAALPLSSQSTVADNSSPQPGDPPSRVARLSYVTGDVSFRPGGLEDWAEATLNYPLTTGDHLFTGSASRAELHIGPNAIRISTNSNFGFLNLDDLNVQTSLTEGSMEIRIRLLADDESFEIDTPNGAITLLRTGDYRIDTDTARDATMLTVRSGQAELFSDGKSVLVRSRQTAYFQEGRAADIRSANDYDDFDNFNAARNELDDPPEATYVPREVTGAEDLYRIGTWQEYPDYGWAWAPPVGVDWTPYSNGRWAFIDPWGWTWIDDAPWGFAPFHYGRWAFIGGRWIWLPGPRVEQPVYAPALVVFVGGGGNTNVSWFPLGPRDPWHPAWRGKSSDQEDVRWANRLAPNAVRTMSHVDFIGARNTRTGVTFAPSGQVTGSAPPVAPSRESVLGGNIRPRPPVANRPLVARTPPPPPPVSFDAKQRVLNQNPGRPLALPPSSPGTQPTVLGAEPRGQQNAPRPPARATQIQIPLTSQPERKPTSGPQPAPPVQRAPQVRTAPAATPPAQAPQPVPAPSPVTPQAQAPRPQAPRAEPQAPKSEPQAKPATPARPSLPEAPSQ